MNRNDGKNIIFLYNLYTLFFYPLSIFLAGFWSLESQSPNTYGRGGGMPIAVLLIFFPEVIFGLKWNLNQTSGGRSFTILCSMVAGWILYKLFYRSYMVRTYAPITYYTEIIMIISGIIWTIVIEFNQTLREHILLFPQDKWLVPNSEDETENSYWHWFWKALFWTMFTLSLLAKFQII